jgi:hypothetical protein
MRDSEVLDRARYRDLDSLELHGFADEVVGTRTDRGDRGVEVEMTRDHPGQQLRVPLARDRAKIDAGHPGHLDIRHDHVHRMRPQAIETLWSRAHGARVAASSAEQVA